MATAKLETAADRYRRIKRDKQETLFDVTCIDAKGMPGFPDTIGCGMVWKARREALEFWTASGLLPATLAAKMIVANNNGGVKPDKVVKQLEEQEIVTSIVFQREVVRRTAVEPRIMEVPEGPNDISPQELMMCCFNTLRQWQMSGGTEGESLESFRKK